jgi:hypothetical protein
MDLLLKDMEGGRQRRSSRSRSRSRYRYRSSSTHKKPTVASLPEDILERQKEILAAAAKEASRKIDYDEAHNEDILLAVEVVEAFLRKKHRICYGGQAMNMHLPKDHKFYDPETSLPDYDFLTPDGKGDVEALTKALKAEGFTEVSNRQGIHEGTTKIYVNYIAVADITEINPLFYDIIKDRAIEMDGITYMDADTLRMMMYLELSRPRGEVERWEKVFERLLLLNRYVKPRICKAPKDTMLTQAQHKSISAKLRQKILNYCMEDLKVLAGADIIDYYKYRLKKPVHVHWLFKAGGPVLFYSKAPEDDLKKLHDRTGGALIFKKYTAEAEFFPLVYIGYSNEAPAVAIIQETACHAYNTIATDDGRTLRIASLDTLITLYLSFLFRSSLQDLFLKPIGCMVEQMIGLQTLYRNRPNAPFPFISIECSGHQKTFASLLREKAGRIKRMKKETLKERFGSAYKSASASASRGSQTRRRPRVSAPAKQKAIRGEGQSSGSGSGQPASSAKHSEKPRE